MWEEAFDKYLCETPVEALEEFYERMPAEARPTGVEEQPRWSRVA